MKVIYSGLESSGKSLKLAKVIKRIVVRNAQWNIDAPRWWEEETKRIQKKRFPNDAEKDWLIQFPAKPPKRFIASNMRFSPAFNKWASDLGVEIVIWENLDDLITFSQCDVIIDEVGNYFDARFWEKLSLDVRNWITQGAKVGVEIYGSAQFFGQVDVSFRRLVNHLYYITKIIGSGRPAATKPPIRRIWGVCAITEQDPKLYDKETDSFKRLSLIPDFMLIQKSDCDIFYTGQKIPRSKPLKLKHEMRVCEKDDCGKVVISHF